MLFFGGKIYINKNHLCSKNLKLNYQKVRTVKYCLIKKTGFNNIIIDISIQKLIIIEVKKICSYYTRMNDRISI